MLYLISSVANESKHLGVSSGNFDVPTIVSGHPFCQATHSRSLSKLEKLVNFYQLKNPFEPSAAGSSFVIWQCCWSNSIHNLSPCVPSTNLSRLYLLIRWSRSCRETWVTRFLIYSQSTQTLAP